MITAPRHNKNKALRGMLLTLTAMSAFTSKYNGMLVSAAPTRKLGKTPKATAPVSACEKGDKLVKVEINTDDSPEETSWAIYNACSPAGIDAIVDGGFTADAAQKNIQYISEDLCLPEKGRYKFKILDSGNDGMTGYDAIKPDYSLTYGGMSEASAFDFKGSGFATYFGEGSCCEKGEKLVEIKINTDDDPSETSWEITDACSTSFYSGDFGDNDDDQEYYQSSNEVCVDENGSYTFKILDSDGDGIYNFPSRDFEFDYSLRFDGDLVVQVSDFNDGSDEVPFGKSSCKEPKASKTPKASKNARHLRNKQSKE